MQHIFKRYLIPKDQLYWVLQISGWTLFYLSSGVIYFIVHGLSVKLFLNLGVNIFLMIFVTHLLRLIVKKSRLINLPIYKLLFLFAFLAALVSVPLGVFNIYFDRWSFAPNDTTIVGVREVYDYWLHIFRNLALWFISYVLFIYFDRYYKVRINELELKDQIFDVKISYLKNQVSPHFLFNSLNSVRTLISIDPDRAVDVTNKLSLFLRKTIDQNLNDLIPIKDELKLVEEYLFLEKVRFGSKLNFSISCNKEVEHILIPPMIIQSLAENAVKHGIGKIRESGNITINAYRNEKGCCIEVINPGSYNPALNGVGVGIRNINQRLNLILNNRYKFEICETGNNNVVATLIIFL